MVTPSPGEQNQERLLSEAIARRRAHAKLRRLSCPRQGPVDDRSVIWIIVVITFPQSGREARACVMKSMLREVVIVVLADVERQSWRHAADPVSWRAERPEGAVYVMALCLFLQKLELNSQVSFSHISR
jgi:hypothetical protein